MASVRIRQANGLLAAVVISMALLPWGVAQAVQFNLGTVGDNSVKGVLNSTFTAGVGVRTQSQSQDLIGKSDLNPNVCAPPFQSCQGLFRDQYYAAAHLAAAPGTASVNTDFGDLNYNKGSLFQAPFKATEDLSLSWGKFGFFGRILYFYDFVNNNFTENHPNEITAQNASQVGRQTNVVDFFGTGALSGLGLTATSLYNQLLPAQQAGPVGNLLNGLGTTVGNLLNGTTGAVNGVLGAALPLRVYGPGGVVHDLRNDPTIQDQAGTALQYLDSYIYGTIPVLGKNVTIKIGRQTVNWGESTTLAINSINSTNPINANNFYRIGTQVEEVFTPINMAFISFAPFENATIEGYYQLEWKPTEAPTPNTYFSDINVGTNNAGIGNNVNVGFGGTAQDPDCVGKLLDNPLSGITPTCTTFQRLPDQDPRTSGQYGIHLDYYADGVNNGTDFGFYYEHYHSRLPIASFYATYPSCARAAGNANGDNATSVLGLLADCPDLPLTRALTGQDPTKATSDTVGFDTAKFQLVYPEDIDLFGVSFNTTVGDYSIQGEVAYRPNKPFQVDPQDLAFAAFGPSLGACGQAGVNCTGTIGGVGSSATGTTVYGPSDFNPYPGETAFKDTFDLGIGALPGSQRSFPNFVVPYRGGTLGQNPACYPEPGSAADVAAGLSGFQHPYYAYNSNSPCYIQGYQRFKDFNFNFGATRVLGSTENWIGADQVILLYEVGAEWIPTMPAYDHLVLDAPNTNYGPTAGADGSGATNPATQRQACSTSPDCSLGPDGLRFNPHQQDLTGFPDKFSWGYRIIALISYENVILPSIGVKPLLQFKQDVQGTSPGPAGNFVAGRKEVDSLVEIRYRSAMSLNVGYTWYWGGGAYNTYKDRDFAQAFVKYQF